MKLVAVKINGQALPVEAYEVESNGLTLKAPPAGAWAVGWLGEAVGSGGAGRRAAAATAAAAVLLLLLPCYPFMPSSTAVVSLSPAYTRYSSFDHSAGEFDLEIDTDVHPEQNSLLEGLYKSGGNYCTQVGAGGTEGRGGGGQGRCCRGRTRAAATAAPHRWGLALQQPLLRSALAALGGSGAAGTLNSEGACERLP